MREQRRVQLIQMSIIIVFLRQVCYFHVLLIEIQERISISRYLVRPFVNACMNGHGKETVYFKTRNYRPFSLHCNYN